MECELNRIITKDGVRLDGIFFKPKKSGKTALLFVHGLTGCFYGHFEILNALSKSFDKLGIGLASFNTRGHGIVSRIAKEDKRKKSGYKSLTGGGAFEKFEDCVFDIEAGVKFLGKQGFTKIMVCGISTGANKTAFYFSKPHSKLASGAILLSPIRDILVFKKEAGGEFDLLLKKARKMVSTRKGDELMPKTGKHFSFSAKRFLSLYTNQSNEDIFPYGNPKAKFKGLSKIKERMFVVFGDDDKSLDRPPIEIIESFKKGAKKTKSFESTIIKKGSHTYVEKEEELTKTITNWILKIAHQEV